MKFTLGLVGLILAITVKGAPQAGPPLDGRPWESLSEQCRPPPCPATGNINVSYPMDCLSYVECKDGNPTQRWCDSDLFWHKDSARCEEIKVAKKCMQCW